MILIINCLVRYSICKHMENWKRAVRFPAPPSVQCRTISTITNTCSFKYAEQMDKFSIFSFALVSALKKKALGYILQPWQKIMPSKKITGWAEHLWRRILPCYLNGLQVGEEISYLAMTFHRENSKSSQLIPTPSYIGQHLPYAAYTFRNCFLHADTQNFCSTTIMSKWGKACAGQQQKMFHSICMLLPKDGMFERAGRMTVVFHYCSVSVQM